MAYPSDNDVATSVLCIARKVFYSEAPIDLNSSLLHDLFATPVDILDVCRHIARRLMIKITRDELLAAIRSSPRDCTLGWLAEICQGRRVQG
jgi:hypothetical protein